MSQASAKDDEAIEQCVLIIRAEANLLRLPVFALHTKGLSRLDGIEVAGTRRIDGKQREFKFTVTRNVADTYPGPLSRKVHFALLSIVSDSGLPFQNPIAFSWRDLAKRMQLPYHGKRIDSLKAAIRSSAGIEIRSHLALKGAGSCEYLPHAEEVSYRLYERYAFRNEMKSGGGRWDANYVWLSPWYLDNLNQLYAGPLDYRLWRNLNEASPIASRMYEFLLFNLSNRLRVLRVNYTTLAQFLPMAVQRYASQARRQLDPALCLLRKQSVVKHFRWGTSKDGMPQVIVKAGDALKTVQTRERGGDGLAVEDLENVCVRELRNLRSPAHELVVHFHRLWSGERGFRPTGRELDYAMELVDTHGKERVSQLLPLVVEKLRNGFPSAKTFGACRSYWVEAVAEYEEHKRREVQELQNRERERTVANQQASDSP